MSNFDKTMKLYNRKFSDNEVKNELEKIKTKSEENKNKEIYKTCFNCIDLTSLNHTDSEESIAKLTQKVNNFEDQFPEMPSVAAMCVYPSMVKTVKETLTEDIGIASVSGGFPSSQTFIEVKIAETAMCVLEGATEIDVVISIGKFLSGDYESVAEEISEIKASCRGAHLKTIIESGSLQSIDNIYKASIISMIAESDFIKTSTGKTEPAATPEAAYAMCYAIKDFYEKTGKKIGFKAAGGIATPEEAVYYYSIVEEILGKEWLNNELFRIGASRLSNHLLSSIYEKEIKYF
ncbi:MAG: deoxyribose-phosphate aldolase [Prevotellaceae bacterium]|jgi:deoxyribose-phosphate aldolase|nr:deoxyribose-phosphate aldolase [Prevotellaceae bacterium]